jgi:CheY-like chemotaxis protein
MMFLIVDDQPRARQSMKALLGAWYREAEVHEASNGAEALDLVAESQPDLVLMDVRMPVMDGLQALRLIKRGWPQVKVILLSMYPEHAAEARTSGADAYVSKSEAPETLREKLAEVLRKN